MVYKYPVDMGACDHYPTKIKITGASRIGNGEWRWSAHCVRCGWKFEFKDVTS